MKTILIIIIQFFLITTGYSQHTIDNILNEIEKNHTGLKAYQAELEAQRLGNRTGIYLPNPEFEYAWFAGSPETIGDRTNISVMQHFRFPSAYTHMKRVADARNEQLGPEFAMHRAEILLQARSVLIQIIHLNNRAVVIAKRLDHATQIELAYKKMLDAGETNIIEYNKAKMNLTKTAADLESNSIERKLLLNELLTLNGGIPIEFTETEYPAVVIAGDFEVWFEQINNQNPLLSWLQMEVDITVQEQKLQRAMNLPTFSAGYVSEALTEEQFRGVGAGISIPLWENKNTMKYARTRTLAAESAQEHQKLHYYHYLNGLHQKAQNLEASLEEYSSLIEQTDNSALLQKAWEAGEINLSTYIIELSFIYDSMDKKMEMERELYQTIAELFKYI